jgi:hypothetical protein
MQHWDASNAAARKQIIAQMSNDRLRNANFGVRKSTRDIPKIRRESLSFPLTAKHEAFK